MSRYFESRVVNKVPSDGSSVTEEFVTSGCIPGSSGEREYKLAIEELVKAGVIRRTEAGLSRSVSLLELEFQNTFTKVQAQIKEKISAAAKLLDEAHALSEKHGIPYETDYRESYGYYWPDSFNEQFKDLHPALAQLITGIDASESRYGGWTTSSSMC